MSALVVLTTTPDLKTARSLAKILVVKKAAACVSLCKNIASFYQWRGKLERSHEVMLFIKTTQKKFSLVKNLILKNHSYSVPEILAIPVSGGSIQYLSWLEKTVR